MGIMSVSVFDSILQSKGLITMPEFRRRETYHKTARDVMLGSGAANIWRRSYTGGVMYQSESARNSFVKNGGGGEAAVLKVEPLVGSYLKPESSSSFVVRHNVSLVFPGVAPVKLELHNNGAFLPWHRGYFVDGTMQTKDQVGARRPANRRRMPHIEQGTSGAR